MATLNMDISAIQQQLRAGGCLPQELVEIFREEAEEHIRAIYDGLDRLCVDLNDGSALADIRRSAHTLKGAAGAVGHAAISRLSHRVEALLDFLFENKQAFTTVQLELLLLAADLLQDLLLGEFDFDEMANSLLDVHDRFEHQFATTKSLDAPNLLAKEVTQTVESPALHPVSESANLESAVESVLETWLKDESGSIESISIELQNDVAAQQAKTEESAISEADDSVYLELAFDQLNASVDIQPEIQAIFTEEAQELLRAVYLGLDRLKHSLGDHSALSEVRRSAHTLKGAAGAVGMEGITRLAHRMEDLLDALTERQYSVTDAQLHVMLLTADCIQDLTGGPLEIIEIAESMAGLYARYDSEMLAYKATNAVEGTANIGTVPNTLELASESTCNALVVLPDVNCEAADQVGIASPMAPIAANKKSEAKPTESKQPANSGQYLRVPLERINGLVALIGEMVVNRSSMNQRLADFENRIQDMQLVVNRFRAVAQDMEKSFGVEAIQQNSRARRMASNTASKGKNGDVPVNRIAAFTHPDFHSTMKNAAHLGLDTLEFDQYSQLQLLSKSIAEATNDIAVITSDFRNIYGDLDSLLERQQRHNRDAQGNLMQIRMLPISSIISRLERTVRTVSNKLGKHVDLVVVGEHTELDKTVLEEITDPLLHLIRNALDHGIETCEQRTAAGKPVRACVTLETLNQGTQVTLRVSDDGRGLDLDKIRKKAIDQGLIAEQNSLSSEELYDLIFVPGFSTAESLTDISGRGVGMDVVREAVHRLKGTIRVESRPSKGATFTIHLPTSLSVTRALIITSGSHTFAIPMQSVEQIVLMDMVATQKVGSQVFIKRNEKLLRLNSLSQHLETRTEPAKEISIASQPILLIRSGDNEIAIAVDSVKGGQDIVVKSLGDHLRHVSGYLGATLTGDGTVVPILDPSDLCGEKKMKRNSQNGLTHETKIKRRKTVMVIDDSVSVRRVATNLLRSHGWDVIDAKDGLDALEKLASHDTPPDIFLCDMEMPRMDGLELIERLRGMPEFFSTPIVMVTSRSSEKHRRLAADAGANEHVVKPFKDDQLIALIERMITEHRELVGI